ncbi:MAG TPA: cysteine dioxygenase [Trebonia sp.]|jgi:predicted metal-dependent enzyme (double-stranded beta helix superfamily)|nr:cysteine dioxygenase [Trebonia sp.]
MAVTEQGILTPAQLAEHVRRLTATPAEWIARVRLDTEGRWYEQIHVDGGYEIWLISWLPGHSTGFHDHGGSAGAFSVVWGELEEYLPPAEAPGPVRKVTSGVVRSFGPRYVHDVRNASSSSVAVSVHAYSPPLSEMTRYVMGSGGLVVRGKEGAEDW